MLNGPVGLQKKLKTDINYNHYKDVIFYIYDSYYA
jgi:hypothetical protein